MVGSAGNAPVVASSFFEDIGFTDRQPDHFPEIGSGSGNHTHLKKFMKLLSVRWSSFPQFRMWFSGISCLFPEMPFCEHVTGTAFQVLLETLSLFNRLERYINLNLPRYKF